MFFGLLARRLVLTGFIAALILFAEITAWFVPTRAARRLRLRRTLRLDAAEGAAQFINLAFVSDFLAFGDFDEFEHFVQLIVQFFQRVGDEGSVRDGLVDGGFLGGSEIGGLDPLALADGDARRWLRRAFIAARFAAKIPALVPAQFARRRFGCGRNFGGGFMRRFVAVRGKISGRFGVRLAEAALGFRLVVFRVFVMFRRLRGRGGWFNHFRGGRNFFGVGRTGLFVHRTRTAAATATATASAIGGGTARGRRVQIGLFVRHKFYERMAAGRVKAMRIALLFDEQRQRGRETVEKIFVADGTNLAVTKKSGDARRAEMRLH